MDLELVYGRTGLSKYDPSGDREITVAVVEMFDMQLQRIDEREERTRTVWCFFIKLVADEQAMQRKSLRRVFECADRGKFITNSQRIVGLSMTRHSTTHRVTVPLDDLVDEAHRSGMRQSLIEPVNVNHVQHRLP